MSTVVQLNVASRRQSQNQKQAALLRCFAHHRRFGDDVFWLKENAELLNIFECTGVRPDEGALSVHDGFYSNVEKRLEFFPQYYRFLLSICLDLEDLGMSGNKGEALVNWVADQGLAEGELSDLQRSEAQRLMARRGRTSLTHDTGLDERLRGFIDRSVCFAMPNKKAAYELTHIVFYLSEYGRKDPQLTQGAVESLMFAGTLAYLDQNADLLAEVCISLRYGRQIPPRIWEIWLQKTTSNFEIVDNPEASTQDDYHEYFVSNWLLAAAGHRNFGKDIGAERMSFTSASPRTGPLRGMSESMFRLDENRNSDWDKMRPAVIEGLSEEDLQVLDEAEAANPNFDVFFEGFARVGFQGIRA